MYTSTSGATRQKTSDRSRKNYTSQTALSREKKTRLLSSCLQILTQQKCSYSLIAGKELTVFRLSVPKSEREWTSDLLWFHRNWTSVRKMSSVHSSGLHPKFSYRKRSPLYNPWICWQCRLSIHWFQNSFQRRSLRIPRCRTCSPEVSEAPSGYMPIRSPIQFSVEHEAIRSEDETFEENKCSQHNGLRKEGVLDMNITMKLWGNTTLSGRAGSERVRPVWTFCLHTNMT